jgi:hypothetical protein
VFAGAGLERQRQHGVSGWNWLAERAAALYVGCVRLADDLVGSVVAQMLLTSVIWRRVA